MGTRNGNLKLANLRFASFFSSDPKTHPITPLQIVIWLVDPHSLSLQLGYAL